MGQIDLSKNDSYLTGACVKKTPKKQNIKIWIYNGNDFLISGHEITLDRLKCQ